MNKGKLAGRRALVTGSGRGIGRAIALGYGCAVAQVVVTARTAAEVNGVVDQIRREGGDARGIPADLLDPAVPADLVRQTVAAFGAIDILVNNAGIGSADGPSPVVSLDDHLWHRTLA